MSKINLRKAVRNNHILYGLVSVYRYTLYAHRLDKLREDFSINILDPVQTSELLASSNVSFVRFGDSELKMLYRAYDIGFQKFDVKLANRLQEILNYVGDDIFVGLPLPLKTIRPFKFNVAMSWASYLVRDHSEIQNLNFNQSVYLDSLVTRSNEYKDRNVSVAVYKNLKKIWREKKVMIFEGEKSRLGVGNDLFQEASSVSRVLVPSENAFDYYEEILRIAKEISNDYDLIIAAIGPTATVLGFDLRNKIRTLDLGHVDIQYEFMLRNISDLAAIPGKYTNESRTNVDEFVIHDENYEKQIVKKIGV